MSTERVFHTFGPVYDDTSRILILGSFPSVVSRKMNFYYANPGNRFWRLLADLFEEEITDRRQFCLDHHIALWDVIASCRIHGSSDASITDVVVKDILFFSRFCIKLHLLNWIFFFILTNFITYQCIPANISR